MIKQVIPSVDKFSKETLLGRIEVAEVSLRQNGDLPGIETTLSALSMKPSLSRSTSTSGNFASSSRAKFEEDKKIEKGIVLLVKRELEGERFFKFWTCREYGNFASKFRKRVNKFKRNFQSRRPRNCLYANDEEDSKERSENEDELGFVAIKEDSIEREVSLFS